MHYPVRSAKDIKTLLGGTAYVRASNKGDRRDRWMYVCEDIKKRAEWGYIEESYITITEGLVWAIKTGRVSAFGVVGWIWNLPIPKLLDFLEEVHDHCRSMLDVVFYLNTIKIEELNEYDKQMYPVYRRITRAGKKGA